MATGTQHRVADKSPDAWLRSHPHEKGRDAFGQRDLACCREKSRHYSFTTDVALCPLGGVVPSCWRQAQSSTLSARSERAALLGDDVAGFFGCRWLAQARSRPKWGGGDRPGQVIVAPASGRGMGMIQKIRGRARQIRAGFLLKKLDFASVIVAVAVRSRVCSKPTTVTFANHLNPASRLSPVVKLKLS